jgi:hypothetical protein
MQNPRHLAGDSHIDTRSGAFMRIFDLFEHNHVSQLQKVVIRPYIQILMTGMEEWHYILFHPVDISGRQSLLQN